MVKVGGVMQVVLRDGRVLFGDFQSVDKQGNIILGRTEESVTTCTGKMEERHMGVVLIPREHQRTVELQGTIEEKLRLLAVSV